MLLSNTSDYAIRILTEIARTTDASFNKPDGRGKYILGETLCDNAGLPHEYLSKILAVLVNAKILGSRKGPHGGFVLAKPAREISLLSVIEAIDGDDQIDWCVVRSAKCSDLRPCRQHGLFKNLRHRMRDYLSTATLADTAASLRASGASASSCSESSGNSFPGR